ncbi:hypothetical protein [Parasitella parasitica]|uniref:Uncharacterized protein n=1 Tax=Parasitella parasitica TaxID=35722 RepID=A0A0B7NIN6_9FUNG|nr:hypothetical protein [Parasitella parasitica]
MTKETNQPKAINIIRPNNSHNNSNSILYSSLSHSSSGSTTSTHSRRTGNSLLSNGTRKPKVAGASVVKSSSEKPVLNLYHPPRKPSYDNNYSNATINKRPTIELYKPLSHQQQNMTKSFTAPSLAVSNESKLHNSSNNNVQYNRPISPSYTKPQQQHYQQQQPQLQQYHRSVLGVINTPVSAAANTLNQTVPSEAVKKSTSSSLLVDQEKSEEFNILNSASTDQNQEEVSDDLEDDDDVDEDEYEDDDEEGDDEEGEEPVVNEARVNRKIEDLELSIKSLLTVNSMLEATVRKQALQLNQFKKQRPSDDGVHIDLMLDHAQYQIAANPNNQDEEEDDWENDALFQKLRKVTEQMIEQGQKSIAFEYKILGRVLSNYTELEDDNEDEEYDSLDQSTEGKIVDDDWVSAIKYLKFQERKTSRYDKHCQ